MRTEQNRTEQIDVLKAVCAFMVVCIHAPFPGQIGECITSLFRIAVPIFFMITGYFYSFLIQKGKRLSQIKKIFLITVRAYFVFICWKIIFLIIKGKCYLRLFFVDVFSFDSIVKFVLFNENRIAPHLWYLSAVLYVLLIAWLIDRFKARKLIICAVPFLLLVDLVLGKYSLFLLGKEFPYYLVRNFLFVGIPYFYIGLLIFIFRKILFRFKRTWLICAMIFFSLTTLCERSFLIYLGKNAVREHYFSTTFLAISIFIYFLYEGYNNIKQENIFTNFLSIIGRDFSAYIYIMHPIFISIISAVLNTLGLNTIYEIFAPIIIYITTTFFLYIIRNIVNF